MLQRVVDVLVPLAGPVVVVAAPDQTLPDLPPGVSIVRDEQEGLGPLGGLSVGLAALRDVDAAYATSCDVPLLSAAFVRAVMDRLGEWELVIPRDGDYHHPLAAVYRTRLAERCRTLLAAGKSRPLDLVGASAARLVDVEELRSADPKLDSLCNANTLEEYEQLLVRAGLRS